MAAGASAVSGSTTAVVIGSQASTSQPQQQQADQHPGQQQPAQQPGSDRDQPADGACAEPMPGLCCEVEEMPRHPGPSMTPCCSASCVPCWCPDQAKPQTMETHSGYCGGRREASVEAGPQKEATEEGAWHFYTIRLLTYASLHAGFR